MSRFLLLTTTTLLALTLWPSPRVQTQQPAQTQQPEKDQFPKPETYPEAGPTCKYKVQLAPWLGTPGAGPGKHRCYLSVYNCRTDQTDIYQSAPRESAEVSLDCSDYERAKDALAAKFICCDKDSSDETKRTYCGDCRMSQGNNCVADKNKNGKACDRAGHCGSCNNGICEPVKMETSRPSLVQTKSTGIPRPKPDVSPAFTYEAKTVTDSNVATYSTSDANANPNTGDIKAPPNPSKTGEPTPGGLAELTVSYTCSAGDTVKKKFPVATFGLSCYRFAVENDFVRPAPRPTPRPSPDPTSTPDPTPTPTSPSTPTPSGTPTLNCIAYSFRGRRYTGVTTNPPGLPPGDYCTAFLADTRMQGSGTTRNGTKIQYVDGCSPWCFKVVPEFQTSDGQLPIPGGSVARDPKIIGGKATTTVKLESGDFLANDSGGSIKGYRLDIFGGSGLSACRRYPNKIEVGACTPGTDKCPELKSPIP